MAEVFICLSEIGTSLIIYLGESVHVISFINKSIFLLVLLSLLLILIYLFLCLITLKVLFLSFPIFEIF
ncbi:hypothetical protein C1646_681694 [Rhizophagus diaphanus]|nr:hypothetical protein C1646_681694 [Rhizophagus diaphanus] [Rhizophagus sp. MUCL 43196]